MRLDGVRLWFEQLCDEVRVAARGLRRTPGFALAAVLTLALGIGAVTSVLSVAYGVLFAPLPVRDAAHVLVMWGHNPNKQPEHFPLSGPEYMAFAREARSFSHVAAVDYQGALPRLVQFGDTVASIRAAMVTGDFFEVLGARPLIGRLLRPDDDVYGTPAAIVLSEPLWRSAYGGDPSVVGKVTKVYTNPVRIVGVLAGALDYPHGAQMWGSYTAIWPKSDTTPGIQGFHDIVARLAPGMSPATARQELAAFFARPAEPHSGARLVAGQYLQPVAEPITDVIVGDVRPAIRLVSAAVALLLLVTCVNLANLLLVRMLGRRRELAVRAALGADRGRLGRLVLTESAILTAVGGSLGIALAWYAVRSFTLLVPPTVPRGQEISLNAPVLAGALALCAGVTLLFGFLPAVVSGRISLSDNLRERRSGDASPTARRVRLTLVGAQVAVAVAMLVVGGVVARGFEALAHDDLGFRADHLLISRLAYSTLPSSEAAYGALVQTALQRLRQIPGVQHVTGLSEPPFRPTGNDGAYALRGDTPGAATNRPFAHWLGADADYFQTLGIALRAGRLLTEDDRRGAPPVAIVDEQLAQQAWPGKNPIGQDIGLGGIFYRVVGVVGTTRYRDVLAPRATVYTTYAQSPTLGVGYAAVRTSVDPSTIIPSLRTAVRDAAPSLYLADFATMNERVTMSLATQRLDALLLAAFAIGILALTSVGLYSVAATFVRYREFEIGVRIALGATPAQVARLVMGQGAVVIVTGVIIGIAGAFVAGSAIGAVSYGASTRELRPIAAAVLVVCTVALVAFAIPGRRAARANAAEVLRRG